MGRLCCPCDQLAEDSAGILGCQLLLLSVGGRDGGTEYATELPPQHRENLLYIRKIVSYTFSEYGKGLRFISFEYGDTSIWKGWYSGRHDCGCTYQLTVCLLDGNMKVLKKFEPKSVTLDPSDCYWRGVSYTFSEYGKGLRFISFENGGKDTSNWKGWYGVRVTDSAIKVHCSV
ncbi:hypothetical protein ACEWY4_013115 [Coilia grayii]|uniref:FBA domain-containing protein n=1 Tax=Coilia grayii TaxID=363190 RepID=A0ABD1JVF9_9TELE